MAVSFKNILGNRIYLCFLLITFLFYGNSLKNKYSLDDIFVTVTNSPEPGKQYVPDQPMVAKGISAIPKIWTSRYAHDGEGVFDYRPVVTTTFAIEYSIFGQNAFVNHLVNLLLYFLCVCLVYRVVMALFNAHPYSQNLAFLCAFLFLIHPLHTEAVDNLKSRDELLSFSFSMLAFIHSIRFFDRRNIKDILIVVLCLILGLASKRTTLVVFFAIPMALFFFRNLNFKKILAAAAILFGVYILFTLVKKGLVHEKAIRNYYHFESRLYFTHPSFIGKVMIALKCLGFYIGMLFFPFPLRFYYGESTFDLGPGINLFACISILFLVASGWYFFKTRNKYFLFALLLFLGTVFPFLNFMALMPGILGERLVFTASFGFSLMLAIVILPYFKAINFHEISFSTFTTRPFLYLSILTLICMVYVINRNSNWYDKFTLFSHDAKYLENSSKGNSLLANEYFEKMNASRSQGEAQLNASKALEHYKLSIAADSSMFSACNNAGVVLFTFYKNYEEAAHFFRLAIRARADYAQAYENLGNTYRMRQKYDTALISYQKALMLNKRQYASYDAIGQVYGEQKKYREAALAYSNALLEYPNEYYFSAQKANYVYLGGSVEEGLALFEQAFRLSPNDKLGGFLAEKFRLAGNKEKEAYYRNYHY